MADDPIAIYFRLIVTQKEYEEFNNFIRNLIGRHDFGRPLENILQFRYAFTPAIWMKKQSVLENSFLEDVSLMVVANCGDAAFHVLLSFLHDWGENYRVAVNELKSFVLNTTGMDEKQRERRQNFSQGELMKWVKEVPRPRL